MADRLYLSVWFPSFDEPDMLPRFLCVVRQFPFSESRPGIAHVSVHAISWEEPEVFDQMLDHSVAPEQAAALASEFLHRDHAYTFGAWWDLWAPAEEQGYDQWVVRPQAVRFTAFGAEFGERAFEQEGHVQVDFGLDAPYLYEELDLTELGEQRVQQNVQKLVAFTHAVEKNCGISGRVLWSDSEENLAQKLITRLQKVQ